MSRVFRICPPRYAAWGLLVAGVAALLASAQVVAQTSPTYDRIEEDWEIVVNEPDPATNAPQLINVISPTWHLLGQYSVFEVNHITQVDYQAGGWQLQRWNGDTYQANRTSTPAAVLSTTGETLHYTLAMSVNDGVLKFMLLNGTSQSWGNFGGSSEQLSVNAPVSNLNGYRTSLSVSNARVGFAGHRVGRFALKEVRYYSGGTVVLRDTEVHEIPIQGGT